MIQRERVSDNVYVFQSKFYAQVNAGAVVGTDWAVAIDTLSYPDETLEIRDFIEQELKVPVRYVIDTHYHADHSWGNCFFPGALVISHQLCREYLHTLGVPSLEEARKNDTTFRQSKIVLPHVTFDQGSLSLKVDKKTLTLLPFPGHSRDGIGVLVEEDRILFSGDVLMQIPFFVDGDVDEMIVSMKKIRGIGLENIVQGHGEVILRGEVEGTIDDHLDYLTTIHKIVRRAERREFPGDMLRTVDVESCGKSRVLLGGLAEQLHQQNLKALYYQLYEQEPAVSEGEW